MICTRCSHIVRLAVEVCRKYAAGHVPERRSIKHKFTRKQFDSACENGCHICLMCKELLPQNLKTYWYEASISAWPGYAYVGIECRFHEPGGPLQEGRLWRHLNIQILKQLPIDRFPAHYEQAKWTGDSRVLDLGRLWFQDCVQSHRECATKFGCIELDYYPERLIDLFPTSKRFHLRLVETAISKIRGGYLSLSHRWGPSTPRLNVHTYDDLQRGMAWSAMPGMLRDVARVAQALGVRYLWIDSLCIFQDNTDDIAHQMQLMEEIYSNSACNILALNACEDSLFTNRNPLKVSRRGTVVYNSETKARVLVHTNSHWQTNYNFSRLVERGWVLQEQLLARRSLYFGPHQISWECQRGRCSETYPQLSLHYDGHYYSSVNNVSCKHIGEDLSTGHHFSDLDDIIHILRLPGIATAGLSTTKQENHQIRIPAVFLNAWVTCVEHYTGRELTFAKDRLPAIYGVAKRFSQVSGYRWVAGLWFEFLPLELLWYAAEPHRPVANLNNCPSWSWASLNGPVCHTQDLCNVKHSSVAKVLEVTCKTVNSDPFTPVDGGLLRLLALGFELALDPESGTVGLRSPLGMIIFPQEVYLNQAGFQAFRGSNRFFSDDEMVEVQDDGQLPSLGPRFVAVVITIMDGWRAEGLILERMLLFPQDLLEDSHVETYRRVAMFEIRSKHLAELLAPLPFEKDVLDDGQFSWQDCDFDSVPGLREFRIV